MRSAVSIQLYNRVLMYSWDIFGYSEERERENKYAEKKFRSNYLFIELQAIDVRVKWNGNKTRETERPRFYFRLASSKLREFKLLII